VAEQTPRMPIEMEPEERQRRMGQIYGLLILLARRKRSAEQAQRGDSGQVMSNSMPLGGE